MSIAHLIGKWLVPPAFHSMLGSARNVPHKDININISPVHLRHIVRYQFARTHATGKSVLDAACGSGYGSDFLEPYDTYTGVDYADYCIAYAQENYGAPHKRFVEGDLYALKNIINNSFDTIVSFETLEHLDDPEKVLTSFRELLNPGGKLIVSIPLNHPDLVYHKKQYSHEDVRSLMSKFIPDNGNIQEYLQQHINISPLTDLLAPDATGTWLGVLSF